MNRDAIERPTSAEVQQAASVLLRATLEEELPRDADIIAAMEKEPAEGDGLFWQFRAALRALHAQQGDDG